MKREGVSELQDSYSLPLALARSSPTIYAADGSRTISPQGSMTPMSVEPVSGDGVVERLAISDGDEAPAGSDAELFDRLGGAWPWSRPR